MARDGADQLRRDPEKNRKALQKAVDSDRLKRDPEKNRKASQKAVDSAKVDLEENPKELTKYQTLVGCTGTQA